MKRSRRYLAKWNIFKWREDPNQDGLSHGGRQCEAAVAGRSKSFSTLGTRGRKQVSKETERAEAALPTTGSPADTVSTSEVGKILNLQSPASRD